MCQNMFQPERRASKSSYPDTPLNLSNMFSYGNKLYSIVNFLLGIRIFTMFICKNNKYKFRTANAFHSIYFCTTRFYISQS